MTAVADEVETNRKEVSQLLEASSLYITAWETKTRQRLSESEAALARKLLIPGVGGGLIRGRGPQGACVAETDACRFRGGWDRVQSGAQRNGGKNRLPQGGARGVVPGDAGRPAKPGGADAGGEPEAPPGLPGRDRDAHQGIPAAYERKTREKAEGMQEKLSAKIEESYRLMSTNLADIDRRVKSFTAQTRLFERADVLKGTLEGSIEEMKKEIAKLGVDKAELAETELQLARTKKIADEISAKLTRFLAGESAG